MYGKRYYQITRGEVPYPITESIQVVFDLRYQACLRALLVQTVFGYVSCGTQLDITSYYIYGLFHNSALSGCQINAEIYSLSWQDGVQTRAECYLYSQHDTRAPSGSSSFLILWSLKSSSLGKNFKSFKFSKLIWKFRNLIQETCRFKLHSLHPPPHVLPHVILIISSIITSSHFHGKLIISQTITLFLSPSLMQFPSN